MVKLSLCIFCVFAIGLILMLYLIPFDELSSSGGPTEKCSGDGSDYEGVVNVSRTNKTCALWPKFWSVTRPSFELKGTVYCRNPNNDPGGVWCFTGSNGRGKEYCDVKCRDGYVIIRFESRCKEVNSTPFQTGGSLNDCSKKCTLYDFCETFEFKSAEYLCSNCLGEDRIGVSDNGWKIYQKFFNAPSCYLSSTHLTNPRLNVTNCDTVVESIKPFKCMIRCAKNYIGFVVIRCRREDGLFDVSNSCKSACYVDSAEAKLRYVNTENCDSAKSHLIVEEDCLVACSTGSAGKMAAKCPAPGSAFALEGECTLFKCFLDPESLKNTKIIAVDCAASPANRLDVEQCVLGCPAHLVTAVSLKCFGGRFLVSGDCFLHRCYLDEAYFNEVLYHAQNCVPGVLSTVEECRVECGKYAAGSITAGCKGEKFLIGGRCDPFNCTVPKVFYRPAKFAVAGCAQGAFYPTGSCEAGCPADVAGGGVSLVCRENRGEFEYTVERPCEYKCEMPPGAAALYKIDVSQCKGLLKATDCALKCAKGYEGEVSKVECAESNGLFEFTTTGCKKAL